MSMQRQPPSESTEVLVLADQSNLYIAFRCYDSEPESLRGRQTRRDARLGFDDQVAIELDPFHNHREISTYAVNVRGTQADSISSGRAQNIEWKGDWDAATSLTEYGWSAEFRIPFDILNYSPGSTEFGANFIRYHHRTKELSQWADLTPQDKPEEMGQLTGLTLPADRVKKTWTLKPYLFAGSNVPDEKGDVQETLYTGGIDLRYDPTPSLSALLTVNPDFSQVEAQVTDIDFSYNEKFVNDPRTFFQEGSAYFGGRQYFYSNRIPDFDAGGKTFGRIGRTRLGILATDATQDRRDLALRLVAELTETDSIGMMVVNTERTDLSNTLTIVDLGGRRIIKKDYSLDYARSNTNRRDFDNNRTGDVVDASLGWRWDHWTIGTDYSRYSKDYLPANGLIKQDLIGTEGLRPSVSYYRDFGDRTISEVTGYVSRSKRDTLDGRTQTDTWSTGTTLETRQQIKLGAYYHSGKYRPVAGEPGDFGDVVYDDRYWTVSVDVNTRSDLFGFGTTHSQGDLAGGDYTNTFAYAWYRPVDRLLLNLSTERLESFGKFHQTIFSVGWELSVRDSIVSRYIRDDSGEYARLGYRRQVRSGLDIFAVYDDGPLFERELSAKVVWTW
jgi:hypothetical protein